MDFGGQLAMSSLRLFFLYYLFHLILTNTQCHRYCCIHSMFDVTEA